MNFFAPNGMIPASGLYSTGHFIIFAISIIDIIVSLYFAMKYLRHDVKSLIRVFTITLTVLEVIKIIFNFAYGYTTLNHWFPLYFCSFYLYALWLAGFGKGKWEKAGLSFLFGASILSGISYLIYPSTSLTSYPAWHFMSIHSFFFHGSMIFLGLFIILSGYYQPKLKDVKVYMLFTSILIGLACLVNILFDANMMFLTNPYYIPILADVYAYSIPLYRILIILTHLSFYFITYGLYKLIKSFQKVKK